jgi:hypothetical protein
MGIQGLLSVFTVLLLNVTIFSGFRSDYWKPHWTYVKARFANYLICIMNEHYLSFLIFGFYFFAYYTFFFPIEICVLLSMSVLLLWILFKYSICSVSLMFMYSSLYGSACLSYVLFNTFKIEYCKYSSYILVVSLVAWFL